jgi:hypothetical protein
MPIKWLRLTAASALIAVMAWTTACGAKETLPPAISPATAETPANSGSSPPVGTEAQPASASAPAQQATATKPAATQESGKPPQASLPASPSPSSAKPAEALPPGKEAARTVTLSIIGNAKWGSVLAPEDVNLQKNDTVADLLIRTLKKHKLAYDTKGSGAMFYVAGIDGLFEFDDGPTSGWKFKVNGTVAGVGAGDYVPKPGDRVEWFYTSQDKDAEEGSKEQAP